MTNANIEIDQHENSLTIFRSLIASLPFDRLDEAQLDDLSAIAAESAEGLCQGLWYIGESLEKGAEDEQESIEQASAYLKASAHLIPALMAICEQSCHQLMRIKVD